MADSRGSEGSAAQGEVLAALRALHSPDTPPAARKQAGDWLVGFRAQDVAWQVSDRLLNDYPDAQEVCVFAAQTLRFKVANQLRSLSSSEWGNLRDGLLSHLHKYAVMSSSGGEVTVRQLCLALAELVLQWGGWESALADCGSRLTSPAFHEFLQVLAEETQRLAGSGSENAMAARCRVSGWAPTVVAHLTNVAGAALGAGQQLGAALLARVMRVFGAWARLGCLVHFAEDDIHALTYAAIQLSTAAGDGTGGWGEAAEAGAAALADVLDHPPDGIEIFVAPHMVHLPHAALRAAAAGDTMAASAIIHTFASFCQGNLPALLDGPHSGRMQEGLLQLALIPCHDHHPQPLALPALEAVGCLMEYAVDVNPVSEALQSDESSVCVMANQLLCGLLPNLAIAESDAEEAHPPGTALRPGAADALAGAARLLGVSACSSVLEESRRRHSHQGNDTNNDDNPNRPQRWQLAEASLFAHCSCAEGTWGGLVPPDAGTATGLAALARGLGAELVAESTGAPCAVSRLASLWLVRWLSAALDPVMRPEGHTSGEGLAAALELAVHGLQAASTVLRREEGEEGERAAQTSASRLALRCATAAVELQRAMTERGAAEGGAAPAKGGAHELLLAGAREMQSLADAQLMNGDAQMQVVLVGAAVALSQVTTLGVPGLVSSLLQPCEPTLNHASSSLMSSGAEATDDGGAPFRAAAAAVTRIYAVVRTLAEAPSEEGAGEGSGQRDGALSQAVALLAACWPRVAMLVGAQGRAAAGEAASSAKARAKFVEAACRAASAAMRADGRSFLSALHPLLQQTHDALQADASATETAAALLRCLAAAVEVYGGWNWGSTGGWAALAAADGADAEAAQRLLLRALAEVNDTRAVRAVASGPDAAPDLAVAMCAVDAAFARFTVPVLPVEAIDAETGRLLHNAVLRAAACVPCNHKNVALAGLSATSALLCCGSQPPLHDTMRGVLQTSGVAIVSGLLGSLLAAAPLTRLHKATSLLVDVVVLLTRLMGGNADAAASLAKEWLQAALANLPPGMLLPGEAAAVVAEWAPHMHAVALMTGKSEEWGGARATDLMASQHGQRLKKAMRAFIQRHEAT